MNFLREYLKFLIHDSRNQYLSYPLVIIVPLTISYVVVKYPITIVFIVYAFGVVSALWLITTYLVKTIKNMLIFKKEYKNCRKEG